MLILYSTGCPKCQQLIRMLDKYGMQYEICTDIDAMAGLGMREVPYLQVGGQLLNFAQAWTWIKQHEAK